MTIAYVLRRWTHVAAFSLVALALSLALPGALGTAHAATKYKVRVDSAPQGATVYVDKKEAGPVGVTPWEGSLTAGSHKIIVELDGYMPAEKTVKIARTRKLQDIFVPLIKKADPPRIDVRADADKNVFGATVYLDGQAQGTVPTLLTTDPGRHLVEIKKEGFQDFSTWVEVKENEKATLTPFLKEIAKPKIGTIVVEADVPDAEVYLDGDEESAVSHFGAQGWSAYPAGKLAIAYWVRSNAPGWMADGIRVNAVAPGVIRTAMTDAIEQDDALMEALEQIPIPAGRWGTAVEVAEAIAFLACDRSSYVVGQTLFVDGGTDVVMQPRGHPHPLAPMAE